MILFIQFTTHPDEFLRWTDVPEYTARAIRSNICQSNASFSHFAYDGKEYSVNREHVAYVALSPEEV